MIKHSLIAIRLLLLSFSVVCRVEAMTGSFVVELEQSAVSLKQNFAIKPGLRIFSGSTSEISETNDHAGADSIPDDKRHRSESYGVETTLIESTSWPLLYTTHLLVAYELTLTTKGAPLSSNLFLSVPVEVVVAVSWLLKSYWNPDSSLFNLSEHYELTQDLSFAITTMIQGSGHKPQCPVFLLVALTSML